MEYCSSVKSFKSPAIVPLSSAIALQGRVQLFALMYNLAAIVCYNPISSTISYFIVLPLNPLAALKQLNHRFAPNHNSDPTFQ